MFMENVIACIWKPVADEYYSSYQKAIALPPEQLFENLTDEMKQINFAELRDEWFVMTNLPVTGCMHCIKKGQFAGCSFCDYYSHTAEPLARVTALKDKRPDLYAKLISLSFKMTRGNHCEPAIVEYVSGHDTLSPEIMTEEVYDEIDKMGEMFKSKALYTFFETRASNISVERIEKWKKHIGDKVSKRIVVEFGVEAGNEWIRNHWLNKNVTDADIKNAIDQTHEAGLYTATSVIIGLPGLNDAQSAKVFKNSFLKLYDMGTDFIICVPLVRKGKTVQDYLYDVLNENEELIKTGAVKGEHTGMPWIVTVLESICEILKERPGAEKKMILGPVYFRPYLKKMSLMELEEPEKKMTLQIIEGIEHYVKWKRPEELFRLQEEMRKNKIYRKYLNLLRYQEETFPMEAVMKTTAEELAKTLWEDSWKEKREKFFEEINEFTDDQ